MQRGVLIEPCQPGTEELQWKFAFAVLLDVLEGRAVLDELPEDRQGTHGHQSGTLAGILAVGTIEDGNEPAAVLLVLLVHRAKVSEKHGKHASRGGIIRTLSK